MPKIVEDTTRAFTLKESMVDDISKFTDLEIVKMWRNLKDKIGEYKKLIEPYDDQRKILETRIQRLLVRDDNEVKSNKVSIPKIGFAYKEEIIGAKVMDWDKFQKILAKTDWLSIMRAQMKQAGLQEYFEEIMKGNVEHPGEDIIKFVPFEKLTIRVLNK